MLKQRAYKDPKMQHNKVQNILHVLTPILSLSHSLTHTSFFPSTEAPFSWDSSYLWTSLCFFLPVPSSYQTISSLHACAPFRQENPPVSALCSQLTLLWDYSIPECWILCVQLLPTSQST